MHTKKRGEIYPQEDLYKCEKCGLIQPAEKFVHNPDSNTTPPKCWYCGHAMWLTPDKIYTPPAQTDPGADTIQGELF